VTESRPLLGYANSDDLGASGMRVALPMQGTETWRFIDGDKTIGVNPRGRFKADNGTALAAAAVAGLGVAYLPDFLTDQYVASGALVSVMTRFPPTEAGIFVVRPPGAHPARKVRILTELLIENFS